MQHPVDADKTYKHAEPMKRAQAIQSGGVLLTFGKLLGAVLTVEHKVSCHACRLQHLPA